MSPCSPPGFDTSDVAMEDAKDVLKDCGARFWIRHEPEGPWMRVMRGRGMTPRTGWVRHTACPTPPKTEPKWVIRAREKRMRLARAKQNG